MVQGVSWRFREVKGGSGSLGDVQGGFREVKGGSGWLRDVQGGSGRLREV